MDEENTATMQQEEATEYRLNLKPQRKHVFVTQILEREEEPDEEHKRIPVLRNIDPTKPIDSGLRSLQKTILLRQEIEAEKVDELLRLKRKEHHHRMKECDKKRAIIEQKQIEMIDRVSRFQRFIADNESKRKRAIQKYETELRLRHQKVHEYQELCSGLEQLQRRHDRLQKRVLVYQKYRDFLNGVVKLLPENYLEGQDNLLNSLMMRHRTLFETHGDLVQNISTMTDELKTLRERQEHVMVEYNQKLTQHSNKLAKCQRRAEQCTEITTVADTKLARIKSAYRQQESLLAQLLMAIDNIAEKCSTGSPFEVPYDQLDLDQKITRIKNYLEDRQAVHDTVLERLRGRSPRSRLSYGRFSPPRSPSV